MSAKLEWVAGIHAVSELLQQSAADVQRLLIQQGRDDQRVQDLISLAQQHGIPVETVSKRELDKHSKSVHQGVLAACEFTTQAKNEQYLSAMLDRLDKPPLLLVLDGITDPHNLGACLRSADAAGVDAVIVPKDKSASLNLTVRKVACGAAETVNFVVVTNLQRCLQTLQQRGIWIVGATDDAGTSLYQQDLKGPLALVMGSEGKGLRRLTREACDFLIAIPMAGSLSSLNVSVATGICLFEAVRQRV